jgi:hypothetical protein
MNLSAMTPQPDLTSSEYCLADPGKEYLAYLPKEDGGKVTIDLTAAKGKLVVEWFEPHTRKTKDGDQVDGGAKRTLVSPFGDEMAVLYIRSGG